MKLCVTFLLLLAYLLFGNTFCLYAENDYSLNDTILLNEVEVVSATKTEVNRNQVPLTISVIDRKTLEESTETGVLSVLSEEVPGLFVTERGVTGYGISNGSAGSVSIHGVGGGNKVLMLFDGQPMWAAIFGHSIPDSYVTSDAERVEVIRGPGSLLYGTNAMGGVINVITKKATEEGRIHGRGRVMYGSYNTQKYMGSAGYKKDKLNVFASLNHDRTDGQRDNSDFHITNGYVRMGYELSDNWDVSGNAIIANFRTVNPGRIETPMFDNWAEAVRSTYSVAVNNKYDKMSGSIQAFYNIGNHKINDGYNVNTNPRSFLFRSDDYNGGIALFESFRLFEGNLFTAGVDAKQWGGHAWNDSINGNIGEIIDKKVNEFAGYVVAQQTLFEKLTINAGIRIEHNEGYGNEWVPQGGIVYNLSKRTTFKASASKGFRSPNIRELYMYVPANPDLKPERMNNYDVSFLQSVGNNFNFEFTTFFAEGENMITTAMIDNRPKNINTGKFINKGFEFAVAYRIAPTLNISANYSFLEANTKLTAAPKHKAFLKANWSIDKFTVSPSVQYIDGLYIETANNKDIMENYALLNCRASYKVTDRISLFVNGENLTDVSYQTFAGYPMPGATVLCGFDIKF